MGCVDAIKSLGTNGYDAPCDPNFQIQNTGLEDENFVIYKGDCQECTSNCEKPNEHMHYVSDWNEPEKHVYRSYFDPKTGYVRVFICPTMIFIKGLVYTGASIVRPFVVLGVEIADIAIERKLTPIIRITTIGRACLYSVSMTFCSLGMVIFPFSTVCMVKLSEVEFAANRGLHYNKHLRKTGQDKFALYLTAGIQPRGHVCERRGRMPKYKTEKIFLYDKDEYISPFCIYLKLGKGKLKMNHCNYGVELFSRSLRGDDKKEIEGAVEKLVQFTLERYPRKTFGVLHFISAEGIHCDLKDESLVQDGDQNGRLCGFRDINEIKDIDREIELTSMQKDELKAHPFINITDPMTLEDLWQQIRDKISQTSEW